MEEQHSFADLETILVNEAHKESFARRMQTSALTALGGLTTGLLVTVNQATFEHNHEYLGALADKWQGPIAGGSFTAGCVGALASSGFAVHRAVQKRNEEQVEVSTGSQMDMLPPRESMFRKTGKKIMLAAVQAGSFANQVKYAHQQQDVMRSMDRSEGFQYTIDYDCLEQDMRWRMN